MYKVAFFFLNEMLWSSDWRDKQNSSATRKTFHGENQLLGNATITSTLLTSVSKLSPLPNATMKVNNSLLF